MHAVLRALRLRLRSHPSRPRVDDGPARIDALKHVSHLRQCVRILHVTRAPEPLIQVLERELNPFAQFHRVFLGGRIPQRFGIGRFGGKVVTVQEVVDLVAVVPFEEAGRHGIDRGGHLGEDFEPRYARRGFGEMEMRRDVLAVVTGRKIAQA